MLDSWLRIVVIKNPPCQLYNLLLIYSRGGLKTNVSFDALF
jgi:hypothetical protein